MDHCWVNQPLFYFILCTVELFTSLGRTLGSSLTHSLVTRDRRRRFFDLRGHLQTNPSLGSFIYLVIWQNRTRDVGDVEM